LTAQQKVSAQTFEKFVTGQKTFDYYAGKPRFNAAFGVNLGIQYNEISKILQGMFSEPPKNNVPLPTGRCANIRAPFGEFTSSITSFSLA
jgi:hypothetical protein